MKINIHYKEEWVYMECPFLKTCIFFQDKMNNMSATANVMKKRYCLGDNSQCARFMVAQRLGRDKVPTDLFPNQYDKAKKLTDSN